LCLCSPPKKYNQIIVFLFIYFSIFRHHWKTATPCDDLHLINLFKMKYYLMKYYEWWKNKLLTIYKFPLSFNKHIQILAFYSIYTNFYIIFVIILKKLKGKYFRAGATDQPCHFHFSVQCSRCTTSGKCQEILKCIYLFSLMVINQCVGLIKPS
jgi:hypothetical protein